MKFPISLCYITCIVVSSVAEEHVQHETQQLDIIQDLQETLGNDFLLARSVAQSLQIQRNAFLSAILPYLNKPEELIESDIKERPNPITYTESDGIIAGKVLGVWTDKNLTIRQLGSDALTEPFLTLQGVFAPVKDRSRRNVGYQGLIERRWPPVWIANQRDAQFQRASPVADLGPFPELYLKENLQSGETASVEEMPMRTPFNVTPNGELIMKDIPMVERRSIPQFGGMVTLYTRTSPLRLLYYGNWCGSGGMGPALDAIDNCCMDHDFCYGEVQKNQCRLTWQKPYTVHYAWRWDDTRSQAYCLRTGDRCGDLTCECDRVAASCFSRHMIDSRLEGNRLRKHKTNKGPFYRH